MIQFGPEICSNIPLALTGEWLETNGLGGYSSSTIIGLNTRRYHGLLTAATRPPSGRVLLVSKFEEVLILGNRRYELSCNQYPGVVHPQGFQYLKGFRLDPFPTLTYAVEGIEIEKTIFMVYGENTTVVQYHFKQIDDIPASWPPGRHKKIYFEIHPLIAFRDYHGITQENNQLNPYVEFHGKVATLRPYPGLPELHFSHDADHLESTGYWYRHFEYMMERERGLEFREDLFNPLVMKFDLTKRSSASILSSTQPRDASQANALKQEEVKRRQKVLTHPPFKDDFMRKLVLAADQFVVERGEGKSVIAGYPWFGDWGRDTLMSIPGLILATGKVDLAKSILSSMLRYADQGMIPNYFSDQDDRPHYNSVDATLWFFEAVRSLLRYSADTEYIRAHYYEPLNEMMHWYIQGTRFGIRMDEDGFLNCPDPTMALTWMDAKLGERVVVPRHGKAVEIQSLWYNALCIVQYLAKIYDDQAKHDYYADITGRLKDNFNRLFWNGARGCLFDVVRPEGNDPGVRPNQIMAVSLNFTMLNLERAKSIVRVVAQELLTPFGLRTLSPSDPRYRGRYQGDLISRDSAYHQGTVWPWLMGPFITAFVRVNGRSEQSRVQAADWLTSLYRHLNEAGLGTISEIFDGDAPHHPRGCIAQAFNVAELIRVGVEDIYDIKSIEDFGINIMPHSRIP